MLAEIHLNTFKCFKLLKLPLSYLTLLSGMNSSGKSSVLQSLVLLHQTMRENQWSTRLLLNGSVIRLGTVTDAVDQLNARDSFEVGVIDENTSCHWSFIGDRQDMSMRIDRVNIEGSVTQDPIGLHYLLPSNSNESAMSLANRIRPYLYHRRKRRTARNLFIGRPARSCTRWAGG